MRIVRFLFALPLVAFGLLQGAWLEDGVKALDEQRYAEAEAIFEKAVASDAKDYVAQFHLALTQSLLNKETAAIAGYERTLELKPGLGEAEMNLGILLAEAGQYARAEQLLLAALEKTPNSANGLLALGRAYLAEGKLAEAEPKLTQAASLEPRFNDALLELANECEKAKNWEAARRIYAPLASKPEIAERLGVVYLAEGKPGEAIAPLEVAVKGAPSAANHYALGIAYLRTKQAAAAIEHFGKASEAEPGNLEMRLTYGRALRDQRQFALAAQQFASAVNMRPESREAWSELAGMLVMMENYPKALEAYTRLETLGETGAGLNFFKAICQDRLKMRKEALESYEKFLAGSTGANPDQEFQARQRVTLLKRELKR